LCPIALPDKVARGECVEIIEKSKIVNGQSDRTSSIARTVVDVRKTDGVRISAESQAIGILIERYRYVCAGARRQCAACRRERQPIGAVTCCPIQRCAAAIVQSVSLSRRGEWSAGRPARGESCGGAGRELRLRAVYGQHDGASDITAAAGDIRERDAVRIIARRQTVRVAIDSDRNRCTGGGR